MKISIITLEIIPFILYHKIQRMSSGNTKTAVVSCLPGMILSILNYLDLFKSKKFRIKKDIDFYQKL
jgi:hypothetical protein